MSLGLAAVIRILQTRNCTVEQKTESIVTVQVSEFVKNFCVYVVLLLFCALFEDTSLIFFSKITLLILRFL